MLKSTALLLLSIPLHADEPKLTYNNLPLGSPDKPLVLRSYLPDPGLEDGIFQQHDRSSKVAKYNPGTGSDVPGEIKPVPGLAAAVGVNFGPALSYVFDTTECRLLYVWQGGFVDMTPYWGDRQRGSRISFDYVPRLVGTLFWKAAGADPIELNGKSISDSGPRVYTGYHLEKGVPVFEYQAGGVNFTLSLKPAANPLACEVHLTTSSEAPLRWRGSEATSRDGKLNFTLTGTPLEIYQGYAGMKKLTVASANAGAELFNQYGCIACHSADGSKGHGPSVGNLAGTLVEIEGMDRPITADADYLRESIKNPNAKVVKGYPPNYMPPYTLPDLEIESLILHIQSLAHPE